MMRRAVFFPHDAAWDDIAAIAAHDEVYAQWWDSAYVDAIHAANPDCKVIPYGNACELRSDPAQGPTHASNVELAAASVKWILPQVGSTLTEAMDDSQTHFHPTSATPYTIGDRIICDDEIMYCTDIDSGVVYVQRDWLEAPSAHDSAAYIWPAVMQFPGSVTMNLGDSCPQVNLGTGHGLERWSDYNARRSAEWMTAADWDGVYIDVSNPDISRIIGSSVAASCASIDMWYEGSQRTDAAIDAEWNAGLAAYQDALHTAMVGSPILTNGSPIHYDAMNGTLFEAFPDSSTSVPGGQYTRTWHKTAIGPNVYDFYDHGSLKDWCDNAEAPNLTTLLCYDDDTGYGTTADEQKRRFAIGTAAIIGSGVSVALSPHHIGEDPLPWPDEYDADLGEPKAAASCLVPALSTPDLIDGCGSLDTAGEPTGTDLLTGAGSFAGSGDVAAWGLYCGDDDPPHYGHATKAYEAVSGEGYMRVDVDTAAESIDQILAYYNIGSVVSGTKYRLTFDAYASAANTQIWPTALLDATPFTTLLDWAYPDGIVLGASKVTYTLDIRAEASGTVDFRFLLGNVAVGRSVFIGEVTIFALNEGDLDLWDLSCLTGNAATVSLETSTQHSGAGCAKVEITASDESSVGEGIKFGPVTKSFAVVEDTDYTVSFWAKADAARYIAMEGVATGSVPLDFGGFMLTTSWVHFEVPYRALSSATVVLRAWLGRCAAGSTVWLDDVTVRHGNRDVWRRDFDNYSAVLNATSAPVSVPLGGYYRMMDGSSVSTLDIAPRDAVFFMGDSSPARPRRPRGTGGGMHVTIDPIGRPAFGLAVDSDPTWETSRGIGMGPASISGVLDRMQRERIGFADVKLWGSYGLAWHGFGWRSPQTGAVTLQGMGGALALTTGPPTVYVQDGVAGFSSRTGNVTNEIQTSTDTGLHWVWTIGQAYDANVYNGFTCRIPPTNKLRVEFDFDRTSTHGIVTAEVSANDGSWSSCPMTMDAGTTGSGYFTASLSGLEQLNINAHVDEAITPASAYGITIFNVKMYATCDSAGDLIATVNPSALVLDALAQARADNSWIPSSTAWVQTDSTTIPNVARTSEQDWSAWTSEVLKLSAYTLGWYPETVSGVQQGVIHFGPMPTTPAYVVDVREASAYDFNRFDAENMATREVVTYTDGLGIARSRTTNATTGYLATVGVKRAKVLASPSTSWTVAGSIGSTAAGVDSAVQATGSVTTSLVRTPYGAPLPCSMVRSDQLVRVLGLPDGPLTLPIIGTKHTGERSVSLTLDAHSNRLDVMLARLAKGKR